MRILWVGTPFWMGSYGTAASNLLTGFERMGHTVATFAAGGDYLRSTLFEVQRRPVYSPIVDPNGNDIIGLHAQHFGADIVLAIGEPRFMHSYGKMKTPWIVTCEVDAEPLLDTDRDALQSAYRVLSWCNFGQKVLAEAGISSEVIPFGVDTELFKPRDRQAAKKALGFSVDDFVIGRVARNFQRGYPKAASENLQAATVFIQRHPDAKLYLHEWPYENTGGLSSAILLKALKFTGDQVKWTDPYQYYLGCSLEFMANMYNAFDVLLAASAMEGFGFPLVEAQASGVPVITTNYASMPELTFAGKSVPHGTPQWGYQQTWFCPPRVDALIEALEWTYQHRGDTDISSQARSGALAYDWEKAIMPKWEVFFENIKEGIVK